MAFREVALGEVCELKRGYDLPVPRRRPGPVPVVSSRGVSGSHDTARVPGPGVVTGRTGTIGRVFLVAEDFWPLNTTLYVRDFKGNDPRFVAHLLETLDFAAFDDRAVLSGVRRVDLHAAAVRRPPLREQRAIARVLDLLDRRAALLRQLDAKLAGMARAMFRLVPSTRRVRVHELCARIGNGATPPRRDAACWNGAVPWFRSGELRDGPLVHPGESITDHALAATACRRWPAGTTLVAMYASPTVGRLGLLATDAAANQACCALVPRDEVGAGFVFHAMLESRARLQHLATGAVQQNISQRVVREHEVDAPDARTARAFSERVAPLWRQRTNHARELAKLAAFRATLLPELVTGRLPAPDRDPAHRP